eukprot:CAMPEP_0179144410 /NCGR_PEP_ID=MMETSP0796-20121207/69567_1 /TAXON_ID=73915 /ORGANISM="Pyrodinium bahamense, Strain pbaha01" /LENGTH=70 /DNA_ID=CAMNT_0020844623 /DNA_START=88 /DNA_END=297 /DNA_ORIENTATION=+
MREQGRVVKGPATAISKPQVDTAVGSQELLGSSEGGVLAECLACARSLNTRPVAQIDTANERYAVPRVPS